MITHHRFVTPALFVLVGIFWAPVASFVSAATSETAPPLITLNFPGGSLTQFTAALEKAYGHPINLIVPARSDISIPAIHVTAANLRQVFAAIGFTDPRIATHEVTDGREEETGDGSGTSVWAMQIGGAPRHVSGPPIARTYSLEQLLTKYTINDITTAVRIVWDMTRTGEGDRMSSFPGAETGEGPSGIEPDLKFHQETKLLIIRGNDQQVRLAWDVLGQLSQVLNPPRGPTRSAEEMANLKAIGLDLEASRLSLEGDLRQLEKGSPDHPQISALKARLRAIEERIKSNEAATNAP